MRPYKTLYGRKCITPLTWVEVGERQLMDPELVEEATEKIRLIRDRLKAAQDRQQKYYDPKHRAVEFEVGDFVFLKVKPMKGTIRIGKVGKLSPRFIRPFEIIKRIRKVALPADMSDIHNDFHMSLLRK
ncbi:hypothetical protein KFK09_025984 [Dendrobium nobile]|uniref:Tf2-1-like SH3-like domain-containing protein n=1 Tax=Dendrobium nobile TaxID=94219 RepID=A0A8T3A6X3_DENNO|nr:hypothetical protein KFK09_025984 [Dendrobium nobile]